MNIEHFLVPNLINWTMPHNDRLDDIKQFMSDVFFGHAHVDTLCAHASLKMNEEHVGSENSVGRENRKPPVPGTGVTHTAPSITNADANAGAGSSSKTGPTGYRVTSGKTTILNTAHSIEKYPKD